MEVCPGELLAIVGESGSGKSITALSVLQLLPKEAITKGKIHFGGNDLLKLNNKDINRIRGNKISMIFQEPMTSLNPVLTCGKQVMESLVTHNKLSNKEAEQKTISLFEKVGLPNPAAMVNRYPHQLSGGQKQRVMIAMAMSCDPQLLIADEPTTALDVTVQKNVLELIRSLQQQNQMGVIFITHDLGLVAGIADKVAVMYKGEIVEKGTVTQVLRAPKHHYTRSLLNCRPAARTLPGNDANTKVMLEVKDLVVSYPVKKNIFGKTVEEFNAVDHVSFKVRKGETVGLVGESGCGKTTLGRAILQLVHADNGEILLNGTNIISLSGSELRSVRKDLQIVFQDPYGSLNPRISIGNAITEPLKIHRLLNSKKDRKDKVVALLEKVGLNADHFDRYPHQFSGGQRQRICIARALAMDPSFLVFDESVSALDVSIQAQVLNLLNDLKKEFGFTSIFISHDLAVVHYISDRIMVMNKGKIVEEGTADQVFYHPVNEYTKQLIAAIPGKISG